MTRSRACAGIALTLLTGVVVPRLAVAVTFGDWEASGDRTEQFFSAATVNRNHEVFGQWCYPGKGNCIWVIGITTPCHKGNTYSVLANSGVEVVQLEVRCLGKLAVTGVYELAFTKFDDVDHIARKAAGVGFAIPLEVDQLRVLRFSLSGAVAALTLMREAASSAAARIRTRESQRGTL